MNWDAFSAVGEWVGVIAVVVTLFYLARQIHQHNIHNDLVIQETILDGFNAANTLLASDGHLAALFIRGLHTPDNLNDKEAAQFQWVFRLYVNVYLKIYRLKQKRAISEQDWLSHAATGGALFSSPGGQLWIMSNADPANADFYDSIRKMAPLDHTIIEALSLGRAESWE